MSPEGLLLALHAIFSRKQTTNTPGISHPWLALLCVRQTSGAITGLRERPVICSDNGIVPRLDTVNHQYITADPGADRTFTVRLFLPCNRVAATHGASGENVRSNTAPLGA